MKPGIWVWNIEADYTNALLDGDDSKLPIATVYEKCHDGMDWQSRFADRAPSSFAVVKEHMAIYTKQNIRYIPWGVPTARSRDGLTNTARQEGVLAGGLARTTGGFYVADLEPAERANANWVNYWRNDLDAGPKDAEAFIDGFMHGGGTYLNVAPDARPGRLITGWWPFAEAAAYIMPQTYWTTFRRSWRDTLTTAMATLGPRTPHDKVSFIFPGDASAADAIAAAQWCAVEGFAQPTIWRRGNCNPKMLTALGNLPLGFNTTPHRAPAPTPTPGPTPPQADINMERVRELLATVDGAVEAIRIELRIEEED